MLETSDIVGSDLDAVVVRISLYEDGANTAFKVHYQVWVPCSGGRTLRGNFDAPAEAWGKMKMLNASSTNALPGKYAQSAFDGDAKDIADREVWIAKVEVIDTKEEVHGPQFERAWIVVLQDDELTPVIGFCMRDKAEEATRAMPTQSSVRKQHGPR